MKEPERPDAPREPALGHEDYERCLAAIREVIRDLDDLDECLKKLAAKDGRGRKAQGRPPAA